MNLPRYYMACLDLTGRSVLVVGGGPVALEKAAGGTLILFMGLERVAQLCSGLVAAGLPASTPAAVVSRGTLPDQEAVTGTLADLPQLAAALESPALVVVGDVVSVGARLTSAIAATVAA
jgi:siroheme synthase